MSTEAAAHAHAGSTGLYTRIWIYLLAITALEVVLAYIHVLPHQGMLFLLMALSVVKAALIMAYFMHLRFERVNLIVSLIPAAVIVISLLAIFFPDGFRAAELRTP